MNNRILILIMLIAMLVMCLIFSLSWCAILEKNVTAIQAELCLYQQTNFDRNEKQDKEIRLLKQDIDILQNGSRK